MSDPTTLVWFTLSGAIFIAILIFAAGVLVGLCCGIRGNSLTAHDRGQLGMERRGHPRGMGMAKLQL